MANKWIGVSANLNPGFLQDIKDIIDPVFAFVQTTLDLVNSVMQFVQAFLTAIGNPIKAILEQLINLLKGFLRDLRNTGLYVTYDTLAPNVPVISEDNLKKLGGGYPLFEQRTIRKFTNPVDPTRPNFSKASSLLCIHAFGGGDLSSFFRIYNAIQALKRLFSDEAVKASLPVPTNLSFEYIGWRGFTRLKKSDISENNLPSRIRVKWSLVPPATGNGVFSSFVSPPPSFLIHVSSLPQGLILGYDKVKPNSSVGNGLLSDPNFPTVGFRWYGNPYLITEPTNLDENQAFYFKLLPQDPKEERLNHEVVDKLQHTYYVTTNSFLSAVGGNDYHIDIPIDALPKDVTLDPQTKGLKATTSVTENEIYVTVQSSSLILDGVGSDTKLEKDKTTPLYLMDIFNADVEFTSLRPLSFQTGVQASDFPQPIPIDVNFKPKAKYLQALREALSWFLLARLDKLTPFELQDDDDTGAVPIALAEPVTTDNNKSVHLVPTIKSTKPGCSAFGLDLTDEEYRKALNILDIPLDADGKRALDTYFQKDKWAFGSFIKDRVDRAVEKVTNYGFPPYEQLVSFEGYLEAVYTGSKEYFGGTISLYEALSDNNFFTETYELYGGLISFGSGITLELVQAFNAYSKRATQANPNLLQLVNLNRFLQNDYPFMTKDSTIDLPPPWGYLYEKRSQDFVFGIEQVIRMSATPLKYRQRDPDVGAWTNIKIFRDGFPAFERVLQYIIDFAQKFADALNNIIQGIIDFIKVLQQRILELKRFIAKIKAIIDAILSFQLPGDLSFLYTVSAGTQGAIRDLITSEDKPKIVGQYSFGLGATLVVGAPVPFVTEIFDLIFGG